MAFGGSKLVEFALAHSLGFGFLTSLDAFEKIEVIIVEIVAIGIATGLLVRERTAHKKIIASVFFIMQ